jgi:hydrophobic/amphiphilic exporter-1 (mainly G- bacteria), HAE1 family
VYAFLNSWRSTLITSLSLPTSVIAAFIAVWAAGFTLNFMTLLGLSLAIGVLIDDAIVVRENIVRHMERGEDRVTAARNGTRRSGSPSPRRRSRSWRYSFRWHSWAAAPASGFGHSASPS